MLLWGSIHTKDNLSSDIEKCVINNRDWQQKQADKNPSVVDEDVLDSFVLDP